jgi:hypothetical protein
MCSNAQNIEVTADSVIIIRNLDYLTEKSSYRAIPLRTEENSVLGEPKDLLSIGKCDSLDIKVTSEYDYSRQITTIGLFVSDSIRVVVRLLDFGSPIYLSKLLSKNEKDYVLYCNFNNAESHLRIDYIEGSINVYQEY